MKSGSDCSGPSAAICQTIGQLGTAKQRTMAHEYENQVDRDNKEISRLEGEEVVVHERRSTSNRAALNQFTTNHPTPTIQETADAQAAAMHAQGDAIERQRQATLAANQKAAMYAIASRQAAAQATEAKLLQDEQATQAVARSQASTPRLASASQPRPSPAHTAYYYKGHSYQSHAALMAAAMADSNCALHSERGEEAPYDPALTSTQPAPGAGAARQYISALNEPCISVSSIGSGMKIVNSCNVKLTVQFVAVDGHAGGSCDIDPSSSCGTGWYQSEFAAHGGWDTYACPDGYTANDMQGGANIAKSGSLYPRTINSRGFFLSGVPGDRFWSLGWK